MTNHFGSPSATPRTPIVELQSGQTVDTYFTCSEKTTATDRNGKTFLRLKLRDATGEVAAIHFDPSDEALGVSAGDVVVAGGTFSVHPQYGAQIQVRRLRPAAPDEYDAAELVPVSPISVEELGERLHALVDSVDEPRLRALLERAFDGSREPGATLAVAPAAVRNHHAYRHGSARALRHSGRGCRRRGVALRISRPRPRGSRRPAPRHRQDPGVHERLHGASMTDIGRLHGEIVVGHDMVHRLIAEIAGFPDDLSLRLCHIIVSHHGMREKGSPVVPQTREAIIVHYCDDMTARIAAVDDAEKAMAAGESWSARIFMIDAPAYFGPRRLPDHDE